ncbi:hypothetical protein AYX14_04029 [Cryptococcus neoformans]|nr:hypothetical protein AYX15_05230 [Cryptococcus neoformans var. grubii]OWZ75974.1 signal recognition particle subunit SRP19 [Cryptococcus neoformans var. grubii Bt85]OXG12634.1 signal recognition particle subunit SRP19 [Cryptococcus neoformans var. grubii Tu401-1]OXM76850.1 signal recognition particle subunit SRP19 [Cryptococcus neoformans var. grubii Bt63]OWZ70566.1 hypothetical protein AYX14_04029 [Cryptococcus neoformans var. grubii]
MPTVEDYFDDDTDLPLPSSSRPTLPNTGTRGALLEEITSDDEGDMDFSKLAEQGRGIFGENSKAPAPSAPSFNASDKGKLAVRDGDQNVVGGGPTINPNTPMGGLMGDMMKLQAADEERLEKLRGKFGNVNIGADPSVYKDWNVVYPLYFDAKVSINSGRRVPRTSAVWWPIATQIAEACKSLGLPSVLEPDRCHPADWENPGRVKVQFVKDGRFINPIIKNRTQLYKHISDQIRQRNPSIVFDPTATASRRPQPFSSASTSKPTKKSKAKVKQSSKAPRPIVKLPTRPPLPPVPVPNPDDRLPFNSPLIPMGVIIAAIKREKAEEKEKKKVGGGEGTGEAKAPKMKKIVVRGKR